MKKTSLLIALILLVSILYVNDNHRVIILADMGNEPDEVQQMTHMITCSNEMDVEGLIAVTGKYLRPESKEEYRRVTHPELFIQIIERANWKKKAMCKFCTLVAQTVPLQS
ncbi:MAG: hypothetical protein MI740_15675 [Halanaerobiales bacterium]|nr:hypothetical protein [Halanaerobiales bacterium]